MKTVREAAKSAAWQRKEGKSPSGGLNRKGVASYRRANPGSKLKMAVTTKPSKLKKGSKAANRRKSFCARMSGMKKRLTSAAGINLGAIVTNTKGIATHKIHINGTMSWSVPTKAKLSIKSNAKVATNNLPTTAAGTRFLFLADLIITAPTARPIAVINPKISP